MLKTLKKISFVFVCLIVIYILLLTITSCIPKAWIEENIKDSDKYFYTSELDDFLYTSGFTDAIMLDINLRIDTSKPLESSLKANTIADEKAGIEPELRI